MTQVQNFTEIPKSDYSLGLRNLFIILLVLVSLVLFLSWDKTLTMDALVEGQKDTVTRITLTPRGKKTTPQPNYSTVTDFARLRGWSTSVPLATAA